MVHTALVLIDELRIASDAGEGLAPDKTRILSRCLALGIAAGDLEVGFGLTHDLVQHQRDLTRRAAVEAVLPSNSSALAAARSLHVALVRYAATKYPRDKARAFADPENVDLFRILVARDGRVPSVETLRRLK